MDIEKAIKEYKPTVKSAIVTTVMKHLLALPEFPEPADAKAWLKALEALDEMLKNFVDVIRLTIVSQLTIPDQTEQEAL